MDAKHYFLKNLQVFENKKKLMSNILLNYHKLFKLLVFQDCIKLCFNKSKIE